MPAALGLTPLLAVIAWMAFRRMVRILALRRVTPWLALRVVSSLLFGGALAVLLRGDLPLLVAAVGGVGLGLAAAGCGLSLARIERNAAGLFFRPNIFVELAVYAVALLRLSFRLALALQAPAADATAPAPDTVAAMAARYAHDPWTTGALFLVIGYYLCFNAGILLQAIEGD
jgi:hypothetical protein